MLALILEGRKAHDQTQTTWGGMVMGAVGAGLGAKSRVR